MLTLPLLRSVLYFPPDPHAQVAANLQLLQREMELEGIDQVLTTFLSDVIERSGQLPEFPTVQTHFQTRATQGFPDGPAAMARLLEVEAVRSTEPLLDQAAFLVELDKYREDVMRTTMTTVLIESANIMRTGIQQSVRKAGGGYQNVTVRGVAPALEHLQKGVAHLQTKLRKGVSEGTFQEGMRRVVSDYEAAAKNAGRIMGVLTGLDHIDQTHHGLRRGELALVLGFVSHMKTTFCLNWFYKAAVYYRKPVALVSLETPIEVMQKQLACLHTTHPKFKLPPSKFYFSYDRVRDGVLTPEEASIFKEVADDLRTCPDYGVMLYKQPESEMTVPDIHLWLKHETQKRGVSLELLVIDYLGLVDPERGTAGLDKFSNLNRAIRATKLMAMEYENGQGIGVVSPFQVNREAFQDADKNGGQYTLRAASGANEAERSADYMYTTYLNNTMRASQELAMGNLKARNAPVIPALWRVFCDPVTRIIDNMNFGSANQSPIEGMP